MFQRFSRSWTLVKASASVLAQDRELLLFPLFSFGALVVVTLSFALPMLGLGMLQSLTSEAWGVGFYAVLFLFYFSQYFVIFFFNTALVGAAMIRLDGGDPTFRDGLNLAKSKIGVIAGYALIAATVGMVLRAIQERVGFIGRIIVGLIGLGWTLATFLVVPVLVTRDVGPWEAVKESAAMLRETWGENVIGQGGVGLAFGFIYVLIGVFGLFLVAVAAMAHSGTLFALAILATVFAIAVAALVQAALTGIYAAALYRYATTGEGAPGFDSGTLKLAFAPKK
jgi:hypothetical protein